MLAALLIAAPFTSLTRFDASFLSATSLGNLAVFLDPYILPIWVFGVVAILYADGRTGLWVSDRARLLGLLAATTVLFAPSAGWFGLPVTFLLGWLVLGRILVRTLDAETLRGWGRAALGKALVAH